MALVDTFKDYDDTSTGLTSRKSKIHSFNIILRSHHRSLQYTSFSSLKTSESY